MPFLYEAPGVDLGQYTAVIFDPVTVYAGADGQFVSLLRRAGPEGRQSIANYMHEQFTAKLATKYTLLQAVAPGTMRIQVTLTGVESNTPVLSTVTQLTPFGIVANGLTTAAGRQGRFSGSVTYAVEVRDSQTNTVLRAFVSKQYPWAEDPLVSVGSYDAAKAGVRKAADALLMQLEH